MPLSALDSMAPSGAAAHDPATRTISGHNRNARASVGLELLSKAVVSFLAAPRHAVIATHDADGEVRQAVVWYALTGRRIMMNALDGRRWPANLRRDPRLSMTVFDGEDYVILRGTAAVLDDPERGQVDARALALRYGGDPDAHRHQARVSILFDPGTAAFHGRFAGSAPPEPGDPVDGPA
jgi:PPOX class probable F420-dependent enzyme